MSKSHRGKGIRSLANHGRGVCGRCKKENIKTLYEHEVEGQKIAVCKFCNAAIKNGKSAVLQITKAALTQRSPVNLAGREKERCEDGVL